MSKKEGRGRQKENVERNLESFLKALYLSINNPPLTLNNTPNEYQISIPLKSIHKLYAGILPLS
jgi:hypothetical protein